MTDGDAASQVRIGAAIVGAQKCGTSTLAAMLDRHPQIRLAIGKEAHLFDQPEVQRLGPSPDDLARFWPNPSPGQMLLDATPSYLYLPGCLEALLRHSPDVRLIVALRHPGDRALSHHGHERRLGFERRSFLTALLLERRRLRRSIDPLAPDSAQRHASYRDRGRYADQLARLSSLTDRVHVVLLHELIADPGRVMSELHRFLDLPHHPVGEVPTVNPSDRRPRRPVAAIARFVMRREVVAMERHWGLRLGSPT